MDRVVGRERHRLNPMAELKAFLALSLYLYICLGTVLIYKSAVLSSAGITFTIWGIAGVKAMILAKFMLLGRMLRIGRRYRDKPLIWPTLYHALTFLLVLLALTTIEELVLGAIDARPVGMSFAHVVGPTLLQGGAACMIMFLILLPYSAFTCLGDALGEQPIVRLFFLDRSSGVTLRDRLIGTVPPEQGAR
jgi:hypothetical protein